MQRYFADIIDNHVVLSESDIHHISHVMRMKIDDEIEIVSQGHLYSCAIKSFNPIEISINYEIPSDSEINNMVTLFYTLAKGDKIDLVVQKAAEIGFKRIVLLSSERCVVKWDEKDAIKKIERFNKIAKEASEQSHRLIVPEVVGVFPLNSIPQNFLAETNLFAYEKEAGTTSIFLDLVNNNKGSISILVGPEGGFSEKEAEFVIKQYGFKPISLGKRILRSETAAIYAMSVISFLLEK